MKSWQTSCDMAESVTGGGSRNLVGVSVARLKGRRKVRREEA